MENCGSIWGVLLNLLKFAAASLLVLISIGFAVALGEGLGRLEKPLPGPIRLWAVIWTAISGPVILYLMAPAWFAGVFRYWLNY